MEKEDKREKLSNGRKAVIVVVAAAFIASATTAMLAFTAAHRAQERDAKALAADTADLRGELATWQALVRDTMDAAAQDRQPYIDRLVGHTQGLSVWKPRTPCGRTARDNLARAMEDHVRTFLRGESAPVDAGESKALDAGLRECDAARGRDVDG
ncbi:hypothetical protein [Luteibacter jiangsuensis]